MGGSPKVAKRRAYTICLDGAAGGTIGGKTGSSRPTLSMLRFSVPLFSSRGAFCDGCSSFFSAGQGMQAINLS